MKLKRITERKSNDKKFRPIFINISKKVVSLKTKSALYSGFEMRVHIWENFLSVFHNHHLTMTSKCSQSFHFSNHRRCQKICWQFFKEFKIFRGKANFNFYEVWFNNWAQRVRKKDVKRFSRIKRFFIKRFKKAAKALGTWKYKEISNCIEIFLRKIIGF